MHVINTLLPCLPIGAMLGAWWEERCREKVETRMYLAVQCAPLIYTRHGISGHNTHLDFTTGHNAVPVHHMIPGTLAPWHLGTLAPCHLGSLAP